MYRRWITISIALAWMIPTAAVGEDWPNWRGPLQNGVAAGKGYPTKWGEEENIAWKVKVPGWGTSTPAIWGERIFVTGSDEDKNALICLNRQGKKLWQTTFGASAEHRNPKAGSSNPSPITDGRHVWAYYKSGDLACVDLQGNIVWQTNLQQKHGPDRLQWDLGTSPVLTEKHVVVAVMHQGPSYLVALDKATGIEAWKQARELGAPRESRDSYTTPLVIKENGQQVLVVLGADHVTAHRADTGEEIWRVGGLNPRGAGNYRQIASPVATEELIIAPYARGGTFTAIRREGDGQSKRRKVAWIYEETTVDVPTAVSYEGKIYLCSDRGGRRGGVICLDAKTGKVVWSTELPSNRYPFSASPILADGKLYVTREDGTTFVFKVGEKPELLATNSVRENTYATPVFVDGQIFLRTSDYLICIGKK